MVYKISDYTLNFYKELDWQKLTFDDSPKEEAKAEKAEEKEADTK